MNHYKRLEEKIKNSYQEGITVAEAEKLASEFLIAQIDLSEDYRTADLDARMRKSGLKAIKAAVYMEAATKTDKKPSDVLLEHTVNMNELVMAEQKALDESEVLRDQLSTYMSVFKESHIHFRNIAKGSFGG